MKQMVLWLLFWGAAALLPAHALQLVDDRGVTVTFAVSPQRIVTLLPSLTETVCELGQCNRLVGVDRYSNYPAQVRSLPQTGGGIDPNIEAIVALRPDAVLIARSSRGVQRLEALGLKVVAMEPRTAADAQRVMGKIGQLLEVPDTLKIWRTIDAGVSAAARREARLSHALFRARQCGAGTFRARRRDGLRARADGARDTSDDGRGIREARRAADAGADRPVRARRAKALSSRSAA